MLWLTLRDVKERWEKPLPEQTTNRLALQDIPVVAIDRRSVQQLVSDVSFRFDQVIFQAIELLHAHGHRRIGLICGIKGLGTVGSIACSCLRSRASALRRRGLISACRKIFWTADCDHGGGPLGPPLAGPDFWGDNEAGFVRRHNFTDQSFVHSRSINIGSVDEIDSQFDGTLQHSLSGRRIFWLSPYARAREAHSSIAKSIHLEAADLDSSLLCNHQDIDVAGP
jgi:hypothetical protein